MPTETTPEQLLAGAANGDRKALASLYALTRAKLFGVALRILKRQDLAEEVLQDAFIGIWNRADTYRPERGSAVTWLATIVRNRAIDRLRRQRRETPLDAASGFDEWPDPAAGPLDLAIAGSELRALRACLGELDDNSRRAILLAYYDGLTQEEIAARLQAPLGTVKSWVRRGLQRLKGCLER